VHHITSQNSSSSTPFLVRVATGHERLNKDEAISSIENRQSKIENPNGQTTTDHGRFPRIVVTLDAPVDGEGALARIPIAITGTWVRAGSRFSISLDDLEEIVRNFRKRSNGEINVDYDHASEMPEVAAGGPIPSAGRIVKLDAPEPLGIGGSGLGVRSESRTPNPQTRFVLYGYYEPTERARKLIASREYRYISPAISWAARDKRTGEPDGTTLTSVALTNRPFLEELPPIRLSDPAYQLVDVGEVHVDTSLGSGDSSEVKGGSGESGVGSREKKNPTPDTRHPAPASFHGQRTMDNGRTPHIENTPGGYMKKVNLTVDDGQILVAHEDFSDTYYADPAEMKQCLADLGGAVDQPLAEAILALARPVENGAEGEAGENAVAPATLSECVAEIRRRLAARQEITLPQAGALLSEAEAQGKSISAVDYFRSRVEQDLDEAVKAAKILPRQRDDWRKIALSDFPTFRKLIGDQKPQVPLRPIGISSSGSEDAQTQVKLLAEQRMRERGISFGQALSEIGREQPDLVHQYRRAVSGA